MAKKTLKRNFKYYTKPDKVFNYRVFGKVPYTSKELTAYIRSDSAVSAMNIYDKKYSPYVAVICSK